MSTKKTFWNAVHFLNDCGGHLTLDDFCAHLHADGVPEIALEYCEKCKAHQYKLCGVCVMCETYNRPDELKKQQKNAEK